MTQASSRQVRRRGSVLSAGGVMRMTLLAALLPLAAQADIILPVPRRPSPEPDSLLLSVGPELLNKIAKAGYDCGQITVAKPGPQQKQGLVGYAVTCANGKNFLVVIPVNPREDGGSVVALD